MDILEQRRILRLREICEITGLGRSTVYKMVADGGFPKPVRLGPRSSGWRLIDIDEWLAAPERRWEPFGGRPKNERPRNIEMG